MTAAASRDRIAGAAMTRMVRAWAHLLGWLQLVCPHRAEWQTADLLEGAVEPDIHVRWCRVCGAVGVVYSSKEPHELRRPDPIGVARRGDV